MLKLEKIRKVYVTGNMKVEALKGVSINFRDHEFVSVLGPSGCGKTTLLNIIGGLDHYTEGELFIDGISTKQYNDRDWDNYRNHRIGFIFQSYNLIPHQTISENVELALAISGVEKKERVRRAHEALDKVGLIGLYKKKPNQLSGGQCQRVAIARALVNDPEILLADEPTGALDSETSTQIMELIKELSKEHLIIMVTHNPDIAKKYSTRTVKLLDGEIIDDSLPYNNEDCVETKTELPHKKAKLSVRSTFKLSFNNLMSKFKRTILVALAGAIGIIGIASVLSVSTGVTNYIDEMQNDMLSGNPITVNEETLDFNSILDAASDLTKKNAVKNNIKDGYINVQGTINSLVSGSGSNIKIKNDIDQNYLSYVANMPKEYYSTIEYDYGLNLLNNIYTDVNLSGYGKTTLSLAALEEIYTSSLKKTDYKDFASLIALLANAFTQAPTNEEFVLSQYELIYGDHLAKNSDEIMIVVNNDYELTDLLLAELGYFTQEEFLNIMFKAIGSNRYNPSLNKNRFSYEELVGKTFTYYPNNTVFNKTPSTNPLSGVNPFTYNPYVNESFEGGKEFKIVSILRLKDGISYGSLSTGFYYTDAFTKEIMNNQKDSEIVSYMTANEKDSITSMAYKNEGSEVNIGITYTYNYYYDGTEYKDQTGFVGSIEPISSYLGLGGDIYTITKRELGGETLPNKVSIYPKDFTLKDKVTDYLTKWNEAPYVEVNGKVIKLEDRSKTIYTDNLSIVISLVNGMISVVTAALISFTALSLVVSTVMVAIITYVSVIERVKEIGVIRSLGGRKEDVSRLFNVETFIIGTISGLIGVVITYLLTLIANAIVKSFTSVSTIATLTFPIIFMMMALSIILTVIAGLIPASLAAKKDPVEALRTE